jgi:DNA-binding CsgD family transcriptional regulator/tetratricopeptide (TPR) repeat protein
MTGVLPWTMGRARSAFVGRDRDVEALRDLVDGDTTVVLVSGDAGIGKSRLLAETLGDLDQRVLRGSCLPMRHRLTLLPFQEMFADPAVVARTAAAWSALPDGLARGLVGLLPEQVTAGRFAVRASEPEVELVFAGVRALLDSLARGGPVVAALEDVHWADAATLDLTTYLATTLRGTEVTLVATRRSDDPDALSDAQVEWLSHLLRSEGAEQLQLERLDRDGVAALMESLLGEPAPAALVEGVLRRGEGNPFFTEQLVAAMTRPDEPTAALPQRLFDFLRARVRGTSPEGARLLEVLAVAARPLPVDALLAVAELDPSSGRSEIARLTDALLVVVQEDGDVRARHALLNEAVLRELPATDRAAVHRRVAEALADIHGESLAAEVASHWRHAGDLEQELLWTDRAADAAYSMGVYAEARVLLDRVLELVDLLHGTDPADAATETGIVELWSRAARAADLSGDRPHCKELAHEAHRRFRSWPDVRERAQIELSFAHQLQVDDDPGVEALITDLLDDLAGAPPCSERARAQLMLASLPLWAGHSEQALPGLEQAVTMARETDDTQVLTTTLCRLAAASDINGQGERALAVAQEAIDVAGASGDPLSMTDAATTLSDLLLTAGRLEEAHRTATAAYRFVEEQGLQAAFVSHVLLYNAGEAALEQGRTHVAATLVRELTDHRLRPDLTFLDEIRAEVDLREGRVTEAHQRLEATEPLSNVDDLADWTRIRVRMHRWAGLPSEALDVGLPVAVMASGTDADYQSGLLTELAGAAADLAQSARARRDEADLHAASAAARRVRELSEVFAGGTRHRVQKSGEALQRTAELARAEGDDESSAWRATAEEWERLGRPHRAAYAWWRLAQALLDQDADRSEVRDALWRAHTASDGHVPLRDAVTALAERARMPLLHEPPGGLEARPEELPVHLTEQEVTVLRLVATGMTNVEIGERLFISPKTVSVHVTNLMRKIDVHSRVQAAAWADQVGLVRGRDD